MTHTLEDPHRYEVPPMEMTMSARAATAMIVWLRRYHPYLLKEAVIPPGYHKHKDPEKKVLRGKYPAKGE